MTSKRTCASCSVYPKPTMAVLATDSSSSRGTETVFPSSLSAFDVEPFMVCETADASSVSARRPARARRADGAAAYTSFAWLRRVTRAATGAAAALVRWPAPATDFCTRAGRLCDAIILGTPPFVPAWGAPLARRLLPAHRMGSSVECGAAEQCDQATYTPLPRRPARRHAHLANDTTHERTAKRATDLRVNDTERDGASRERARAPPRSSALRTPNGPQMGPKWAPNGPQTLPSRAGVDNHSGPARPRAA
eukprot:scaffold1637_cov410-Prasinococcus_capsulatus_cf.AAC.39